MNYDIQLSSFILIKYRLDLISLKEKVEVYINLLNFIYIYSSTTKLVGSSIMLSSNINWNSTIEVTKYIEEGGNLVIYHLFPHWSWI